MVRSKEPATESRSQDVPAVPLAFVISNSKLELGLHVAEEALRSPGELPTAKVPPLRRLSAPTEPIPESLPFTITVPAAPFTFRPPSDSTVVVEGVMEAPAFTTNVPEETVVAPR